MQGAVYRLVSNFAREGRTNRLILLHGPNGSAKSTLVACLQRALEHYSTLDEGALYRFNWIFPSQRVAKGGIGFGGGGPAEAGGVARQLRLPRGRPDRGQDRRRAARPPDPAAAAEQAPRACSTSAWRGEDSRGFRPAHQLINGDLSHRNRQIFEALLSSYHGDIAKVLRHVQVERFFVSRRYRQAVATVEPQLAVDARSRQLTMDRSLSSLPPALQSLTLYEVQGELVDGNRGVLDFADLLKRPLESFKYLLGTVEQGRTSIDVAVLEVDTVFIASSNEGYLAAFKELPEFQSFKGRMELVRAPYLLDYRQEQKIYEAHIQVLHRRRRRANTWRPRGLGGGAVGGADPHEEADAREVPQGLAELVSRLAPLEKALLYAGEGAGRGLLARAAEGAAGRARADRARVGRLPQLRGPDRAPRRAR